MSIALLRGKWHSTAPLPLSANPVTLSWKAIKLVSNGKRTWKIYLDCSQSPPSWGQKHVSKDLFHYLSRVQREADCPVIPQADLLPHFTMGATLSFLQLYGFSLSSTTFSKMVSKALQSHWTFLLSPWIQPVWAHELVLVKFSEVIPDLLSSTCWYLFFSLKFLTKQRPGKPCLWRLSQIKHQDMGHSSTKSLIPFSKESFLGSHQRR